MISHISTSAFDGGSAISARRIHSQLLSKSYESLMFVGGEFDYQKKIYSLTNFPLLKKLDYFVNIFMNKLGLQYFFIPSNIKLNGLLNNSSVIQLYNLHGGYFQLSLLKKLDNIAPLVWRLSDYWPMTGHCAYPGDCQKWKTICKSCPDLKTYPSVGLDNTKLVWETKKRLISDLNLSIVVPSNSLFKKVKNSPILKDKKIFIIPNGVDTKKFSPLSKNTARKNIKIKDKFSILFIAQVAFNNYRKGTHILEMVLEKFKNRNDIQFLIAGVDSKHWKKKFSKNVVTFDYNNNDKWKKNLYNSADLLIFPSINENFPNVLLESMSCGLPALSFNFGGVNEIIDKETGLIIKDNNVKKFLEAVSFSIRNKKKIFLFKKYCREKILKNFSIDQEISSYIKVYEEILNEKL